MADQPEGFDFEEWRDRFPDHWDEDGWPATESTWRSYNYPQMRVTVIETVRADRVHEGSAQHQALESGEQLAGDVRTFVSWDGGLEELLGLFTYHQADRWNIDKTGFVYGTPGIDRDGRWRSDGPPLEVIFDRAKFGGPDTWHINFGERLPFFKPINEWAEEE